MTSSASVTSWLLPGRARTTDATPVPPALPAGRHLAQEGPGRVRIAAPEELTRAGRPIEQEWSRELHDPRRDEVDAFEWLGFGQ
jgi:hypothetical protein